MSLNNQNTSIEATMATGRSTHGGLSQSIHNTGSSSTARSAVPSRPAPNSRPATDSRFAAHPRSVGNPASTPLNGLANTSINTQSGGPMNNHIQSPVTGSAPRSSDARNYYGVTNSHSVARPSDDARNYYGFTNSRAGNRAYGLTDGPRNHRQRRGYAQASGRTDTRPIPVNSPGTQQDTSSSLLHIPMPKHQEVVRDQPKPEQPKLDESKQNLYDQFQAQIQKSRKITQMGGAYTLEPDLRDELWESMDLKLSKYTGYESWVVPFPAGFDFGKLLLEDANTSYEYFDSRFMCIVFRTHKDKDGKELSKEILLSPANPSIDLEDLRLRSALMDAYWKLGRWVATLMAGEKVNLAVYLKRELQIEIDQKREHMT